MTTESVKIFDTSTDESKKMLKKAGQMIRDGGLVVFPTETVYGLGGNALDSEAAKKIYAAKGRPSDNPLIMHIAAPCEAEEYALTNDLYYKLAEAFMPGPLTVVMKAKESVPSTVTAGLDTVAIRCPSNTVARALIKSAGVPIAAPSANLSGSPSPTCYRHVYEDMNGRVDMIIDGGDCVFGLESTIVKIDGDNSLTLLRPGAVTLEDLCEICSNVTVASAVLGALGEGEKVLSPGMKYKHYAPKTPFYLLAGDLKSRINYIKSKKEDAVVLCYEEEVVDFSQIVSTEFILNIGKKDDTATQAHRLFTFLRDADAMNVAAVYAELPSTNGMGMALYNRMIRAAAHQIIQL